MRNIFYLPAFIAGTVLTLAFAPFEFRPLAIISPAILFYLLTRAQTLKHHLLLSYLFGLGLFATGASWIFYSMYFFAHAWLALALLFTTLFVSLMALFFLLLGWLSWLVSKAPRNLRLMLLLPAAWVITEWVRGWFLTGFPWLYLGHSHIDNMLVNVAPLAGSFAVSWFSATLSGLLTVFIIGGRTIRIIAASSALLILLASFLLGKVSWTKPLGEPLDVALIQANIPQEKKWLPETLRPSLELYQKLTDKNRDADIVIWPETAIAGYFNDHVDDLILPLQQQAMGTGTDLLIGGFYGNGSGAENSILAISGAERAIYSKHHLVPFSEYIPFLDYIRWLEKWIQLPYDSVVAGTGPTTLRVRQYLAQMSVCYEDAYGDETIKGLPEANFLVNLSNDGWFTGSIEPYQHMEIARMRSVETGRYMLRSTNIGISGVINEKGDILSTAPAYQTVVVRGSFQPFQGVTPYVKAGNRGIISLMAVILLIGVLLNKKST